MKNCEFCGTQISADSAFCANCGHPQQKVHEGQMNQVVSEAPEEVDQVAVEPMAAAAPAFGEQVAAPAPPYAMPPAPAPEAFTAPVEGQPMQSTPPQEPAAYYPATQPNVPGVPPAPKAPSKLAIEAKGYFPWLTKGMLGTTAPMNILFAAIVPFLVAFFFTLGNARGMGWHAGAFFLTWFINIIFIGVLPIAVWFIKKYWEKNEAATLESVFAEYSSYHNIALPVVLFAMILGMAISVPYFGAHIVSMMFQFVRYISLGAALACLLSPRDAVSKTWLKIVAVIGIFVLLLFIVGACYSAGFKWGFRSLLEFPYF